MDTCLIERAARESPELIAWIAADQTISFMQLHRDVTRKADDLHRQNICEGAIFPIATQDPYEITLSLFAAWRRNASCAIFNPLLPLKTLQHLAEKTRKKSIFRSLLLATSGSTAEPKIAILSWKSLQANAQNSVPLKAVDRWLLSLPLYHVSGIGIVLRCILAKAAIVLDKAHRDISHLSYVPTQLYRESPVYPNLKCLLLGGAPLPIDSSQKLPIYRTYGLTEMGSMVLVKKNAPCMDGQWYLGHPLPGREMRLAEDGEIWVRGSTRFDGYLDCDPLPPNAWFPTKDIGRFDPEKGFAILGRKDWQFISRGENIQPEEIEREILQIPGVLEAIVIPQKNPEYGTVPVAIVQSLHKDLTLNQITEYLSASLPKYKIPKGLHAVETFPRIGNKIDRKKVILNYS